MSMSQGIRHLLFAWLFLLAQAGALAHGVGHFPDQAPADEPACEQCLAFAPLGAGVASAPPAWFPPAHVISFDATVPVASPIAFQPTYRSRAPPSLNR